MACKSILKSKVSDVDALKREISILRDIGHHPHIIEFHDVFEDAKYIHLVTELCTGGELYDRVVEKTQSDEHHFSEYDAARILRNILDAIAYCHDHDVVHRDLKAENFLLLDKSDDAPVKIIDFGLSRYCPNGSIMQSRVGTPYYVAPEVLSKESYSNKCDIWSIGVIAYILLCGFPPFYASNEIDTLQLVKEANVDFPSPIWDDVSKDAQRFIRTLLQKDPSKRPSAKEALQDAWLQQEKVQPKGLSRKASFVSPDTLVQQQEQPPQQQDAVLTTTKPTTLAITPKSLNAHRHHHEQRTIFQKFLVMIKVRKAVHSAARML